MNVFLDVTVLPLVTGIHLASGWRVRMAMLPGVAVTMEPGEARELARELMQMADVLDGDRAGVAELPPYDLGKPAPGSHETALTPDMIKEAEALLSRTPRRPEDRTDDQGPGPC